MFRHPLLLIINPCLSCTDLVSCCVFLSIHFYFEVEMAAHIFIFNIGTGRAAQMSHWGSVGIEVRLCR